MRRLLLVLLLAMLPIIASAASGEQRIALVIGNAHYALRPLANPINDAHLIAERLKTLGFTVTLREDMSRGEMIRTMQEYGRQTANAKVSFFYYAGHGVQLKGKNYLLPVDARLESEDDIQGYGVDMGILLDKLNDAKNRPHVVVLDACRNNPFRSVSRGWTSGLAGMEQSPEGTMIAFSTSPNNVAPDGAGANSIYTQALAEAMLTPHREIELVFKDVARKVRDASKDKQVPWYHSSLVGDVVLNGEATAPAVAPIAKLAPIQPNKKLAMRDYAPAAEVIKAPRINYQIYTATDWERDLLELQQQFQQISRDELPGLTHRAEAGDAKAQTLLGMLYDEGVRHSKIPGTTSQFGNANVYSESVAERSNPKAFKWYGEAARQGYLIAQNDLGQMYFEGRGTTKDYVKAFELIKPAAEAGIAPARLNLAQMYMEGLGVKADPMEATKWLGGAMQQVTASAASSTASTDAEVVDGFKINPDGTATDTRTHLVWTRCFLERNWVNGSCATTGKDLMRWDTVASAVAAFNARGGFAGYQDWRLPTIEELEAIKQLSGGAILSEKVFIKHPLYNGIWSQTDSWLGAKYLNIFDGAVKTANSGDRNYVLLVKSQ